MENDRLQQRSDRREAGQWRKTSKCSRIGPRRIRRSGQQHRRFRPPKAIPFFLGPDTKHAAYEGACVSQRSPSSFETKWSGFAQRSCSRITRRQLGH